MPLGREVGLGPGHIVLDGDPAPPHKGHGTAIPQFSPMSIVVNREIAGWIRMSFGIEVGLAPGHVVLGGNPAAPSPKGEQHTQFLGQCSLWPNGWMN